MRCCLAGVNLLYAAVALVFLTAVGCPKPQGPTAGFSADVLSGLAPLVVHFTEGCSAGSSAVTGYAWDFGDGGTSVEADPVHTYGAPGLYTVALTVTTSVGTDTQTETSYIAVHGETAQYTPGDTVTLVSETVGDDGMELVGPSGTPLEGVRVVIPPATLADDTPVTLGYNTGTLIPADGVPVGPTVVLDVPIKGMVQQPFEITVPHGLPSGSTLVPIPYYIDEDGTLSLVESAPPNQEGDSVTFLTYHASSYQVVAADEELCDFLVRNRSFEPLMDGFQIVNRGSILNRQGECLGMTSWALWYFLNHKLEGSFYPRFMETVGTSGLTGQDIIATRAFTSVTQMHDANSRDVLELLWESNVRNAAKIRNGLVNSHGPVMLRLYTPSDAAHAVLAYAYRIHPGQQPRIEFDVYDPDYPGTTQTITLDTQQDKWSYRDFDTVSYYGNGSFLVKEAYFYILDDALSGFHASRNAVLDIQSHHHNDDVTERVTTLRGTIESGEVAVTQLTVWVNNRYFKTSVGYDGDFSIDVPVEHGENHLAFVTEGPNADGELIPVFNDTLGQDFILQGTFELASIRVTLTWDKNYTDLDLYVIDPEGEVSWYNNRQMSDGGVLDYDDRWSGGPEHWTLPESGYVHYNQPYKVRVHYYADNGYGPVNYTVHVLLFEDTYKQTTETFRGVLRVSNRMNDKPDGTGPDWADVATVTPPGLAP